jgi:hypothetical protein
VVFRDALEFDPGPADHLVLVIVIPQRLARGAVQDSPVKIPEPGFRYPHEAG